MLKCSKCIDDVKNVNIEILISRLKIYAQLKLRLHLVCYFTILNLLPFLSCVLSSLDMAHQMHFIVTQLFTSALDHECNSVHTHLSALWVLQLPKMDILEFEYCCEQRINILMQNL